MLDRLTVRQFVLTLILGTMTGALGGLAYTSADKDIFFALGSIFSPIMLLLAKGLIDSDESNEEKSE